MSTLTQLQSLINHPAPALVFDKHAEARFPERTVRITHKAGRKPTTKALRQLHDLAEKLPALSGLLSVYSAMDGAELFCIPDGKKHTAAIRLLPVQKWAAATKPWLKGGDMHEFMGGCEMYNAGPWRVIAQLPSEEQSLVIFFGGKHRGRNLAGRMFCIGLDGDLGFEEQLAPSFDAFMKMLVTRPASLFDRIGFTGTVETTEGLFGDPIAGYLPNAGESGTPKKNSARRPNP